MYEALTDYIALLESELRKHDIAAKEVLKRLPIWFRGSNDQFVTRIQDFKCRTVFDKAPDDIMLLSKLDRGVKTDE
jgi:hypothetical protein